MSKKDIIALIGTIMVSMLGTLLFLGMAWMLCSCKTRQSEVMKSNMHYEATTSERTAIRHEQKEIESTVSQLLSRADSLQSTIKADSVVATDGTKIYGASIVRNYYHPELSAKEAHRGTIDIAEMQRSAGHEFENSMSNVNSQANSGTSVIAEPPDVTAIVLCVSISAIVAAIIMIRILKKQK